MIEVNHVDLNIVTHCNFSCAACSHLSPMHKKWEMSVDEIERDLEILKPFLKPKNVTVVGGEPLLHPKLVDILYLLKRIRIDEKTTVITNGSLLRQMGEDFWKAIEHLRISVYPGKLDSLTIPFVDGKAQQHGFTFEVMPTAEFFRQFKKEPDDGVESFKKCPWKIDCFTVHRGYFYLCPQATFFYRTLAGKDLPVDGLALDGITEDLLRDYMNRDKPFVACRACAAADLKLFPWKEAGRAGWFEESKAV